MKALFRKALTAMPLVDCFCGRFVWKYIQKRRYFHDVEMLFLYSLPKGAIDTAVDVGAAMGSYSWVLDRVANRVVAFEPGETHSRCLERMTFRTNIEVVKKAVGDATKKVQFFTPGQDRNSLRMATVSASNPLAKVSASAVVEQTTLDDFFANRHGRIDFLKVDVEGYELSVFKGAREILTKHHPLILCEIEARHNPGHMEVFVLLNALGYRSFVLRGGAFYQFDDDGISHLQTAEDYDALIHGSDPSKNRYINNFFFQHPMSKVKVTTRPKPSIPSWRQWRSRLR